MTAESKGNFLDFLEEISKPTSTIRDEFINELYRSGVTAEDLLGLFHKLGYDGVSLDDCAKLLVVASQGPLPCDFSVKY